MCVNQPAGEGGNWGWLTLRRSPALVAPPPPPIGSGQTAVAKVFVFVPIGVWLIAYTRSTGPQIAYPVIFCAPAVEAPSTCHASWGTGWLSKSVDVSAGPEIVPPPPVTSTSPPPLVS